MSLESLVRQWKEVRNGLVEEARLIPADQYGFRATPETRSVAELLQHVVASQKVLVCESCREDSNLMRRPWLEHVRDYAPEVASTSGKDALIELLQASIASAETTIRAFGDEALAKPIRRFDGAEMSKLTFLTFAASHEMYHRGQLTVFERLLQIEPALTTRFKKMFASASK